MKKYKDLVAAAIAFNAERGDQLIVENLSFDSEAEILFREAIVGLAEICRHARSSANDLINQAVV